MDLSGLTVHLREGSGERAGEKCKGGEKGGNGTYF